MQMPKYQKAQQPKGIRGGVFLAALIAVSAWVVIGCNPANDDQYEYRLVLQGQMYVGHAPEIRLTHTVGLRDLYDVHTVGVSGASVQLTTPSGTLNLVEKAGDSRGNGYYGLDSVQSYVLAPGEVYSIRVASGGDTLTAETRAAGAMQLTQPSSDADTSVIVYGQQDFVMRWNVDDTTRGLNRGYWAVYENLNPYHGQDSCWLNANNGGGMKDSGLYSSFWSAPAWLDSINSPPILFSWSGLYRVRVFSCDQALWTYANTYQPGQTSSEPRTNVNGGLGVFTVGGVDTTYFYMAKNPNLHD